MKKLGIWMITLFMVLTVNAQETGRAEELLKEVSSKVENYDNILIDFKYTLKNDDEQIQHETRGDVSLDGEKYLLNIMGTTRMFDGKKLYTIIPENEEVNISTHHPGTDQDITPSKMLTFYKDGYNAVWDITQNVNGRKIQYVKLTPTDESSEVKNILLGIDKQTQNIYNLIQTNDDGSKVTITVKSFKTNQPLPASLFQFKEERYKNYYINRLD